MTNPFLSPITALVGTCSECEDPFAPGQEVWSNADHSVVLCEECIDGCDRCHRTTAADDMMYDSEDCSVCDPCFEAGHARWKRAKERSEVVARAKRGAERANAQRIADKDGVLNA